MRHHDLCQCVCETFLPGDSRPWSPRGLAVQDDRHAVDHGAVGGSGRDIWGDACGATNTSTESRGSSSRQRATSLRLVDALCH